VAVSARAVKADASAAMVSIRQLKRLMASATWEIRSANLMLAGPVNETGAATAPALDEVLHSHPTLSGLVFASAITSRSVRFTYLAA
jgi:hypothetical protein